LKQHGVKQIVIAHSHGGNVARIALNSLSNTSDTFLITMATPFMEVSTATYIGYHTRILGYIEASFIALLFHLGWVIPEKYGVSFLSMLFVLSLGPSFFILVKLLFLQSFVGLEKTTKLVEATTGGMSWHANIPVLIIRAVDDEATFSLVAGAIGNRLSLAFARFVVGIRNALTPGIRMGIALTIILLILALLIKHFQISFASRFIDSLPGNFIFSLIYLPGFIALGFLLLAGVFKSVYGRELIFGSFLCEVNSHSAPDLSGLTIVATLAGQSPSHSGLRHSIYDHERCVSLIAEYLEIVVFARVNT
jgi:hypothetical protein